MVSFQCSPLATPSGIIGTFKQCAELQRHQDMDKFVACCVLDEIGLAEDSPRMPLKVYILLLMTSNFQLVRTSLIHLRNV